MTAIHALLQNPALTFYVIGMILASVSIAVGLTRAPLMPDSYDQPTYDPSRYDD